MSSKVNKNPFWDLLDVLYKNNSSSRSYLEGKLLTIVEAVARDEQQREAVKSIMKTTLWENWRDTFLRDVVGQFTQTFEGKTIESIGDEKINNIPTVDYFPKK